MQAAPARASADFRVRTATGAGLGWRSSPSASHQAHKNQSRCSGTPVSAGGGDFASTISSSHQFVLL
jgi:hypothetical protein